MSEDLGSRLQNLFKTIYDAIDLRHLRPMKRQMFKCGIECLDEKNSVKKAENCIDDCGRPLQKAMNLVQNEVNVFQGRIDRCLMDCQDGVRKEKDEQKAKTMFDSCAEKCVHKFTALVPEVIKPLTEGLDGIKLEYKIN